MKIEILKVEKKEVEEIKPDKTADKTDDIITAQINTSNYLEGVYEFGEEGMPSLFVGPSSYKEPPQLIKTELNRDKNKKGK